MLCQELERSLKHGALHTPLLFQWLCSPALCPIRTRQCFSSHWGAPEEPWLCWAGLSLEGAALGDWHQQRPRAHPDSVYDIQRGEGHCHELLVLPSTPRAGEQGPCSSGQSQPGVPAMSSLSPERHSDMKDGREGRGSSHPGAALGGWTCLRGCFQFITVTERFALKTTLKNILFQPPHRGSGGCGAL